MRMIVVLYYLMITIWMGSDCVHCVLGLLVMGWWHARVWYLFIVGCPLAAFLDSFSWFFWEPFCNQTTICAKAAFPLQGGDSMLERQFWKTVQAATPAYTQSSYSYQFRNSFHITITNSLSIFCDILWPKTSIVIVLLPPHHPTSTNTQKQWHKNLFPRGQTCILLARDLNFQILLGKILWSKLAWPLSPFLGWSRTWVLQRC